MQISSLENHNFTVYNDPHINRIIASQVREISKQVLPHVRDAVALILIGGYARGEGSVIATAESLIPLGDYDFLLITAYPHLSLKIPSLELLRKKFHVQYHIEVGHTWKTRLSFVDKQIYWYEVKFGGKLVYGNRNALNSIPIQSSSDIDPKEGFRLMFNRLMSMLMIFNPSFIENSPSKEQKEDLIFQSVKAILACGESLLLLKGKYHYSYAERWRRISNGFEENFPELTSVDSSFKGDFEKASSFKLRPSYETYNDPVRLWFQVRQHLLQTLTFYLTKTSRVQNYTVKDNPFTQFPTYFLLNSKPQLFDYLAFNRNAILNLRSMKGIPKASIAFSDIVRLTIYYLTLSISEDGDIDSRLLEKSLETIEPIYPVKVKIDKSNIQQSWLKVRDTIFSVWQNSRQ